MKDKNRSVSFAACFGIASAWFGTHCGSGFATGAQGVSFWTSYGAYAVFLPFISVAVMAVIAYIQWEFCRQNKTYNYRAYANKLFSPYDKALATIYELLFVAIMVMGVSSVFAGAGQLVSQMFGFPYVPSVIAVMAVVVVLNMFGTKILVASSSFLSIILITVIVVIGLLCIGKEGGNLAAVVSSGQTEGSLWKAIFSGVLYGSFQSIIVGATTNLSEGLKTKKDALVCAILGLAMNGSMMVLMCYMLMCYYPTVNTEQLPVLKAVSELGFPILEPVYSIMVFLAFMTTALANIGALLKRVEGYGANKITNQTARRALYAALIILVCFGIAQFGLLAIVKKGYTAVGYCGIPFVIIPTLILGIRKITQGKKEEDSPELS